MIMTLQMRGKCLKDWKNRVTSTQHAVQRPSEKILHDHDLANEGEVHLPTGHALRNCVKYDIAQMLCIAEFNGRSAGKRHHAYP
jgi:hypothetical protein